MKTLLLMLLCATLGVASATALGAAVGTPPAASFTGRLYVLVEPGPAGSATGVARGEVRAGDVLHIAVESPPGAYVTLLAFDRDDQLVEVGPANALSPENTPWQTRLQVDTHPGREQVVALVSPRPVDVSGALRRANGAADRASRLRRLRAPGVRVLPGPELDHP